MEETVKRESQGEIGKNRKQKKMNAQIWFRFFM